jgi:hypothetical protein
MVAKTTPYYCLFFNLPQSFFVYNGGTENTEIFSSWYRFFICYFLVCKQANEEHKLLLLCVSCCFLFFSTTSSRPINRLNGT